jgi:hypothetical protein
LFFSSVLNPPGVVGDQPDSSVSDLSVSLAGLTHALSNAVAMTPIPRGLDDEWISVMTSWQPIQIEQLLMICLFAWKTAPFVNFTPM